MCGKPENFSLILENSNMLQLSFIQLPPTIDYSMKEILNCFYYLKALSGTLSVYYTVKLLLNFK